MKRIYVICEGQTEEAFINHVVQAEFASEEIFLYPFLIGIKGKHKGGNVNKSRLLKNIEISLLQQKNSYVTTFFDYYGSDNDIPGKKEANQVSDMERKHQIICRALSDEVAQIVGESCATRFIPFVQMYEFEAILFSDPAVMAEKTDIKLKSKFESIVSGFSSLEHINNSKETSPSHRILDLYPEYEKVMHAVSI